MSETEALRSVPETAASPGASALLQLRDVHGAHEGITVLHGVRLSVAAGQVVALLGPNGAGKTTTLRVAAGAHPLQAGRLLLGGRDVTGANIRDLARAGGLPDPRGPRHLPQPVGPRQPVDDDVHRPHPQPDRGGRVRALPRPCPVRLAGGRDPLRRRAADARLARGLAADPAVLLLDELSMGLAPLVVGRLYEQVAQIARQGVAVLTVEQFATAVLGIADHASVLVRGRIAWQGRPDSGLRAELSALYLGNST